MSTDWCRGFGGAPWECRYFSISPFCWSEMCTGQPSFYLPFGFYFSLGCFHWFFALHLFCFSDKAGVFVGSSVVVLLFFLSFLRVYPVHSFCLFVCFSPFFFSFFFFCIYYEFILAVSFFDFPFFFWVSCEGDFFSFFSFNLCTGCQGVKMYFWVLWLVWIYSL